ncbi:MAG: hypothetical protein A2087_03970 [Spirochaetes bacterium GWD1_61_31]|nr:MAG: hypothetical protein A2Y37_04990 [Spirochaetes bacterium GWB1_60_80]OHD32487.1 MAG: hypothetical protein A2004_12195 [Spirochaetes bacterium GWC1_61_12]OHD42732.1 MAG: hypothetical protein A2087_03970 [Spirochaetes bacterium GWD1_61_31]OHD43730.1 MAG: hypothetical protein A2Y35_00180 [Spirochaetes bacterium GWE1_60_18]OHD60215.1 MAG: hypothetical protein A2Y32_07230 [Spirochaetes bacterium GWF1_60_12]HAW87205.1 hypothetical protein [Spirochaetaceae bacterium]
MLIWARPSALWLLGLLLPIIILYFLRTRWKSMLVGSTFIWRQLAGHNDGGRRLRRRSLWLLLLQLLAALAIILAVAGPAWRRERLYRPGVAFVVDVSASMSVPDGPDGHARLRLAEGVIAEELASLAGSAPVALFAASVGLEPVYGPGLDRAALLQAAGGLRPSDSGLHEENIASAWRAWLAGQAEEWQLVLITDGCLIQGGRPLAEANGGRFRAGLVGSQNAPPSVGGLLLKAVDGGVDAVIQLLNSRETAQSVVVRIERDGRELFQESLVVQPGWQAYVGSWPGSVQDGAYHLRLEPVTATPGGATPGAPDSSAWPGFEYRLAVNHVPPPRILICGPADPLLRVLLTASGAEAYAVAGLPGSLQPGDWDLLISTEEAIPDGLPVDSLTLGPLAAAASAAPDSVATDLSPLPAGLVPVDSGASHPVGRFVDWSGFGAVQPLRIDVPQGGSSLAVVGESVVAAAWTTADGWRRVSLALDAFGTGFAMSPAWPVFLHNVLAWCRPPVDSQSAWSLPAGRALERAVGPAFHSDGLSLQRSGARATVTAFSAGWYEWTDERSGEAVGGPLAVNVDPWELDARPRPLPPYATVPALARFSFIELDLSPWLIGLACFLLVGEWLLWQGARRRPVHEALR